MQGLPVVLFLLFQICSSSGFHIQALYVQQIPKSIDILLHSDALRNWVPFVQFKKLEKHPSKSGTFSKVAG